jgi:hypothetical protein
LIVKALRGGFRVLRKSVYFCHIVKKFVIAILALLYITTASGVMVNIHYCMGHVASVSYGYDNDHACGKCGMKAAEGCCHTEFKMVKLQDEHQLAKANFQFIQLPVEAPVKYVQAISELRINRNSVPPTGHSPPDARGNLVYLYNNVFLI